jgi:lipopolysaccharide export system permease protein
VPLARSKPRESRFRIFIVAIALYVGVFSMASVTRTWVEQGTIGPLPGLWGVHLTLGLGLLVALLKPRV